MRRDDLCGVETTPGNRCLLGFAHPGQHLDRETLRGAFESANVVRGGVEGTWFEPDILEAERMADVVVALLSEKEGQ